MPNNSIIFKNKMSVKKKFKKKNSIIKNKSKKVNRMVLLQSAGSGRRKRGEGTEHTSAAMSDVLNPRTGIGSEQNPKRSRVEAQKQEDIEMRTATSNPANEYAEPEQYVQQVTLAIDAMIAQLGKLMSGLGKLSSDDISYAEYKKRILSHLEGLGFHICDVINYVNGIKQAPSK